MTLNPYKPPETNTALEPSEQTRIIAFVAAFLVTMLHSGLSLLVNHYDARWINWYMPTFALCNAALGLVCGWFSYRAFLGGLFGGWLGFGASLVAALILHDEITLFIVFGPIFAILPYGFFYVPAAILGSSLVRRSAREEYFPESPGAKAIRQLRSVSEDVSFLTEVVPSDET